MSDLDTSNLTDPKGNGDDSPPIGAIISERWELVDHIGEGGMSNVYKARHVIMHKFGAVKFLKGGLAQDPTAVKRFQQEALTAATLAHPNIVQMYDCGLCEYGVYLIMEILPGVSLYEVIDDRAREAPDGLGILPVTEALPIFLQICDGLEHAHKKGIVHRDIKPSNIMLVEPELPKTGSKEEVLVKLVDFGLAKMVGKDGTSSDGRLTRTGEVFGSPVYMSPEHCLGKKLDGRSDIYSLGCLMYECVTGRKVLVGLTSTETMLRHVEEDADLRGLLEMKDAFAKPLAAIIEKCLQRDPGERYSSIGELRTALAGLDRANSPGRLGTSGQSRFQPLTYLLVAGAAMVTATMAVALYSVWPVPAIASVDTTPIAMPVKSKEKKPTASAMSPRLYNGGETFVAHLQLTPERKLSYCLEVTKRADQDLVDKQYDDAEKRFGFVTNLIRDSKDTLPAFPDLLLHAMVGRTVAASQMQDLDGLDIGLGNLIKGSPEYFNASNEAKRYALQWRATVQKDNGSYASAAATISQMLAMYSDSTPASPSYSSEDVTQKALWTGFLADLLRLTGEGDNQSSTMLDDYSKSLAALQSVQISDPRFEGEMRTFRARLYYRYGLALARDHQFPEAYKAFQSSLDIFADQAGPGGPGLRLIPEVEAARVQAYQALKHYDWWGFLKYRLQNHV